MSARHDVLVVGAGFSGAVMAERLAASGMRVLVIDKRHHIAGNAHDVTDSNGVLIHPYGPHIFHTNSDAVVEYLSAFTEWRPYEHRVLAKNGNKYVPIPINIDTVNVIYGLSLNESTIQDYYDSVREHCAHPLTSEDVVLNAVGQDLYERFFRGYTRKQWGLDPSELAASVAARIPTRTNHDDRYFTDSFQSMPSEGYTKMFERILDHPLIDVELGVDYFGSRDDFNASHTVYTGPIDAFFGNCYGALPYRSIRFEHEHLPDTANYQTVGTINYPNDFEFTRITEFKHLTGQTHNGTSIVREFPTDDGDPYYPVPRPANEALYKQYEALAELEKNVTFLGRLAQYRYYNMDQCVGAALKCAQGLVQSLTKRQSTREDFDTSSAQATPRVDPDTSKALTSA